MVHCPLSGKPPLKLTKKAQAKAETYIFVKN